MLVLLDSESGTFDLTGAGQTVLTLAFTDPRTENPGRIVKAHVALSSLANEAQVFTYWAEMPTLAGVKGQEYSITKPTNALTDFHFWTEDILVPSPTSGSFKLGLRLSTGADTSIGVAVTLYDISGHGVTTYFALDHLVSIGSSVPSIVSGTYIDQMTRKSSGTFDRSTDSLEALADALVAVQGSGFGTASDSLHAIRTAIDTLVAPRITSAATVGIGTLGDIINRIRKYTDEPGTDSAYTNAELLTYIQDAWIEVYRDVCMVADWRQWVTHDIVVTTSQTEYQLPPNFDQILALEKMDSQGQGYVLWDYKPRHRLSAYGPGWTIEGSVLRFEPKYWVNETLRLTYRPSGQVKCHEGVATAADSTSITLAATPTVGTLDTRKNAYAGYIVRILGASYGTQAYYEQQATIKSYDELTRKATISGTWAHTPTGTITYEVLPQAADQFKKVIALKVSRLMASVRANTERSEYLNTEYQDALRSLRAHFGNMNQRIGKLMHRDTRKRGGRF